MLINLLHPSPRRSPDHALGGTEKHRRTLRVDRSLGNDCEGVKKLSFRMDVKVEKVLEDGAYDARLINVEQRETKFGERLMWTFEVAGENTEVVGFTSMSPSTKAKAYQWAVAI